MAIVVAEHTLLSTIDLSEACKKAFHGSMTTKNLKIYKTKCKSIIVNVLAPHRKKILREDVNDSYCSTGVGKLFVWRAAFEKNVAAAGRTHSLQKRKFTRCGINAQFILNKIFLFNHSLLIWLCNCVT